MPRFPSSPKERWDRTNSEEMLWKLFGSTSMVQCFLRKGRRRLKQPIGVTTTATGWIHTFTKPRKRRGYMENFLGEISETEHAGETANETKH